MTTKRIIGARLHLTDLVDRGLELLTFSLVLLSLMHGACKAGDYATSEASSSGSHGTLESHALDGERHKKISLFMTYLRQQGLGMIPGMPDAVRNPTQWMNDNLRNIEDGIGDELHSMTSSDDAPSPSVTGEHAASANGWLSPYYHRKGFLPFRDAVVFGLTREKALTSDLSVSLHPYYGQNWISTNGYWGAEAALTIGQGVGLPRDGKLAIGIGDGDTVLMDRKRGLYAHGEVPFTEHLSLNAGLHEDAGSSIGNYVTLQWKALTFEP